MSTETRREISAGTPRDGEMRHVRVAIVGAGFSGLGMAIQLKRHGIADFVVIERGSDVGGTWRDNTYPGCACDVPSHLYSYSFAPNPNWSRRFSPQGEIQQYLRDCAARFGVAPHIRLNEEVREARWDERACRWQLATSRGRLSTDLLVFGNGPLSEPALPKIPGLDRFAGTLFHSAQWNATYDLTGKRVAVIGTGASAIQFVPQIQPRVAHLTLFQRTPPWILPRLDRAITCRERRVFRALPLAQQLERAGIYMQRETSVLALVYRPAAIRDAERLALRHLCRQVADPALRGKLMPTYTMGCKRILLSDDFYPALTQPNVSLVTERIREVREGSIVTEDGQEREIDTILCGTGFHVTDMPAARYVYGRDGLTLAEAWREGPEAYLGTTVAGFPNFFLLIGPNTGLGHTSMVYMIESQVAYILDCLRQMRRRGARVVEVRRSVQSDYNAEMRRRTRGTVWASGCSSWYLDAGGKNTTIWPGFTWEFRRRTRRFDAANYELRAEEAVPDSVGAAVR